MEKDPALTALRHELDELGFVVVPHGEHLCVRLPLLASVRVHVAGGALRLHPQFGPFGRSRALLLGAVGLPAAVATAFATLGAAPISLAAAAGAVAYLLSDAYRLVLTEGCITRLQLLWAGRTAASRPEAALAPGVTGARLGARPPNEALPPPAHSTPR